MGGGGTGIPHIANDPNLQADEAQVAAYFFGGFRVEAQGEVIQLTGTRVARGLLAYLFLNPDRHHLRTRLAGMFWPDATEAQARQRLRSALWKIRTSFSDSGIEVLDQHPEWVAVAEGVAIWVDVVAYRQLVASTGLSDSAIPGLLMAADELYRGDFLPGHYEDWVFEEQEELRSLHRELLRQLMKFRESEGRYEQSLLIAQRMLAITQLDEATHRDVMRLNAILNRPEDANRVYRGLKGLLKYELGTEPSQETERLADDIARQVESTLSARRSSDWSRAPVFVARQNERSHLIERLESVIGGHGSIVLVEGPPGVGKSSLLEQLGEDAKWRNVEVVWGNYRDRSTEAFEALRSALEASLTPLRVEQINAVVDRVWIEEAGRILPSLALSAHGSPRTKLDGEDGQWRMREALVQVLCGLARVFPTLLVLEDVHWADVESLEVLESLTSRIDDLPIAICLSYRRHDIAGDARRWSTLSSIDRHSVSSRVELGDLDVESVASLLRAIGGFETDPELMAERLVQQTSGNPLFVMETLKSLRDAGVTDRLPDQLPVAESVSDIVEHRLAMLGEQSRDVISGAAVFARAISVSELARLTGIEYADVLALVTEVVQKQILNDHAEGLLFSHALVRRIAYDRTRPGRLQELHAMSAALLEEIGAPPAEIAHHYAQAAQWDQAAVWGYEAAQAAERVLALDTAMQHYESAADALVRGTPNDVLAWSLALGSEDVADVLGLRDTQERLLTEMEILASSPVRRAEYTLRRGRFLANTDRYSEAQSVVGEGIALQTSAQSDLEVLLGQIMIWSGKPEGAIERLSIFEADHERSPEVERVLGVAYAETHNYQLAHEHLRAALGILELEGDAEGRARVLSMIGTVYMAQGELEDAEATLSEAYEIAHSIGFRKAEADCRVNLATIKSLVNRPGAALRAFEQADEAFLSLRNQRGSASVRINMASVLAEVVGDFEAAQRLASSASKYFEDSGDTYRHLLCEVVLAGVLTQSNAGAGIERLEMLIEAFQDRGEVAGVAQAAEPLVAGLLSEGELDRATEVLDRWASLEPDSLSCRAAQARCLAAGDRPDEAEALAASLLPEITETTPRGYRVALQVFLGAAVDSPVADRALELAKTLLDSVVADLSKGEKALSQAEPVHAEIIRSYSKRFPATTNMEMPSKENGPSIRVNVTVFRPTDAEIASVVDRRRHQLSRVLDEISAQGGNPSVKHLVKLLGASHATIKRDLAHIRAQEIK